MRLLRLCSALILLLAAGSFVQDVSATSMLVRHMNLQQMCNAAGRIFRGTVLGATEGTVTAGGGQLTTFVYRIRVDEQFKGTFELIKGQRIATLQMVRGAKRVPAGWQPDVRRAERGLQRNALRVPGWSASGRGALARPQSRSGWYRDVRADRPHLHRLVEQRPRGHAHRNEWRIELVRDQAASLVRSD